MEQIDAPLAFTALGHPGRLAVFRLLMRRVPQATRPGEIARLTGVKPNTLSHHLADLEAAGLIHSERQGRAILYSVALENLTALVGYLVADCGRGRPELSAALIAQGARPVPRNRPLNVLFICSGNSARSIFAEAILRDLGGDRFRAFSAGTRPGSALNPIAVDLLRRNGLPVAGLRAKHIAEFELPGAPRMDFVFTVCDAAASEECAPWPGAPLTAHWGVADPVQAEGTEAERGLAFARAFSELHRRIAAFAALPFDTLDRLALQQQLDRIGLDDL